MPFAIAIHWFRQDLRLADNPGLSAAAGSGLPVMPLHVLDEQTPGDWAPGGASRWWLHHSLAALAASLEAQGSRLVLRRGRAQDVIMALCDQHDIAEIHWNRCYEPFAIARDTALKQALQDRGIRVVSHHGALLHEPWTIRTRSNGPFKVYTPFARACRAAAQPAAPIAAPDTLPAPAEWPESETLEALGLLPSRPDWAGGLRDSWQPGEKGAQDRARAFLDKDAQKYAARRDFPEADGTSRLSPALHWGEISPRQLWHAAGEGKGAEKFRAELLWREFTHHLLFHFPDMPEAPLNPRFEDFPWEYHARALKAWQRGQTGYPIVDAGMRQLWQTGWMHNRVRMVVGSFLVKHLRLPWQEGERWFWDTLVDADLANNAAGWQWIAGCGADAAPYFRIFNPTLQGEKFDPEGAYVRRYVPELGQMPAKHIHAPWKAPAPVLKEAGVTLGQTYPEPIVDHGRARAAALDAFHSIKDQAG